MIRASLLFAAAAMVFSFALHAGSLAIFWRGEITDLAGGVNAVARSGNSFRDVAQGGVVAVEPDEMVEPEDPQDVTVHEPLEDALTQTEPDDQNLAEPVSEETPADVPEDTQRPTHVARETPQERPAETPPEMVVEQTDRDIPQTQADDLAPTELVTDIAEDELAIVAVTPEPPPEPTPAEPVQRLEPLAAVQPEPLEPLSAAEPMPMTAEPLEQPEPEMMAALPQEEEDAPLVSSRPKVRPDDLEVPEDVARESAPSPAPQATQEGQSQRNERSGVATGQEVGNAAADSQRRSATPTSLGQAERTRYGGLVFRRIERRSRSTSMRGEARVNISIAASGALTSVSIATSSGNPQLDQHILQNVRRASPFAPPPGGQQFAATLIIKGGG